jgi:hypothetical protein
MRMLLNAALLQAAAGNMHDVIDAVDAFVVPPECPLGCMNWTDALNASEQATSFADPSILPSLGARCAIPGRALHSGFAQGRNQSLSAMERAAFYGPICPCRTSAASPAIEYHTCTAPLFVPEQINLQLANSTTVVVSFVTHELSPPMNPPVARLALASGTGPLKFMTLSGVLHWYETSHVNGTRECEGPEPGKAPVFPPPPLKKCNVRNTTMHFIRLPSLEPRQNYTYHVPRSADGNHHHKWSQNWSVQ